MARQIVISKKNGIKANEREIPYQNNPSIEGIK
jgi:hypothetical protein